MIFRFSTGSRFGFQNASKMRSPGIPKLEKVVSGISSFLGVVFGSTFDEKWPQKGTSKSIRNMSIRCFLADPLPGGAPGFIFDRFLMILGSIFECIFDDIYAWYAVFFFCFHLHLRLDSGDIAAVLMFDSYNIDVEWCGISCGVAEGLLWYCCGVTVGFLWLLCGSPRYYYGIAVRLLWYCCDRAVGFPWLLWDWNLGVLGIAAV